MGDVLPLAQWSVQFTTFSSVMTLCTRFYKLQKRPAIAAYSARRC